MEEKILRIGEEGEIYLPEETLEHMKLRIGDAVEFITEDEDPESITVRKSKDHIMIPTKLVDELKQKTGRSPEEVAMEAIEKLVKEN